MNPDSNKAVAMDLLDAVLKSWWTVIVGACLGLAGAVLALHQMPRVYEAKTRVRIAPQTIPEEFMQSTVTDDMSRRLVELRQAVLTRSNMVKLIERNFNMPESEAAREDMIRSLQSRVTVTNPRNSWLFTLRYRDRRPERAAEVVNNLTRLYVEQNQEYRSRQAESTREQFEQLAREAKARLDTVEQELNSYRAQHVNETGAALDVNLQKLETRRRDLESNRTNQKFTRQRLDDLRRQLAQGDFGSATDAAPGSLPGSPAARLALARRELADLLVAYSEDHPDVRKKKREVGDLEKASPGSATDGASVAVDPRVASLRSEIEAQQLEIDVLQGQERSLRNAIASIERSIDRTPEVQSQLTDLEERRRQLNEQYLGFNDKAERARNSEYLEQSEQGQRLEVIEWAVVPFRPISPDPLQVRLVGLAVGILLLVGPMLLSRLLNPVVSSETGLKAIIDVPVLVSIPRVTTRQNFGYERKRLVKNLGLSLLATAALAAVFVVFG